MDIIAEKVLEQQQSAAYDPAAGCRSQARGLALPPASAAASCRLASRAPPAAGGTAEALCGSVAAAMPRQTPAASRLRRQISRFSLAV